MSLTCIASSEFEALNIILRYLGQAPLEMVLAHDGTDNTDALTVEQILFDVAREVEAKGWDWNTETITFTPDEEGKITVTEDILYADSTSSSDNYVLRGRKLFNRDGATYVFTSPVEMEVIRFLAWEDLPQNARNYIIIRAARKAFTQLFGSADETRFTLKDETDAQAELVREEIRANSGRTMIVG